MIARVVGPAERENLRVYLDFFDKHRESICGAVQQAVPIASALLCLHPSSVGAADRWGLFRESGIPLIQEELAAKVSHFAREGGQLFDWLQAGQIVRSRVLSLVADESPVPGEHSRSVLLGLGLFLDLVTAQVGQHTATRQRLDGRYRLALDAAPTGIAIINSQGNILYTNVQIERMFGYAPHELSGKPIETLVPGRFREAHLKHRVAFGSMPTSRMMGMGRELYGLRKDGSEFQVEIGLNPSQVADDGTVLVVVADISERKRILNALVQKMEELQRSNEELEQFAYVASHDLQEPLRMVVSYSTLLLERYHGRLDEKADKYIRYAVEGATRLQQLVAALLAYSRVGSQGRTPKPVNAQAVLKRTLDGMRRVIEESGAQIEVRSLPVVVADEVQLLQIFQNLIGNSLKFRRQIAPRIVIAAQPIDGCWQFSFQDNGIGIESEHSSRIFQMFQRLHERGKYDGNGIGLAIAKKIIERHHGRIWFESVAGEGTTFFFTLPMADTEGR